MDKQGAYFTAVLICMVIRLPTLYVRFHKFSWYFCDFIRFSTQRRSSRSKPLLTSTAPPCHLVSASCPPRTTSCQVRVCTTLDCWNGHSMERTRFCNMSGSLLKLRQHRLLTVSSSTSHMSI